MRYQQACVYINLDEVSTSLCLYQSRWGINKLVFIIYHSIHTHFL